MAFPPLLDHTFLGLSNTDSSSHIASASSTPPTTVADTASMHSDASKHDMITVADYSLADAVNHDDDPYDVPPEQSEPWNTNNYASGDVDSLLPSTPGTDPQSQRDLDTTPGDTPASSRSRRSRRSAPTYNLAKLSGTSGHGRRRVKGDSVSARHLKRALVGQTPLDGQKPARAAESETYDGAYLTPEEDVVAVKVDYSTPTTADKTANSDVRAHSGLATKSSPKRPRSRVSDPVIVKRSPQARRVSTRRMPVPEPTATKPARSTKRSRKSEPQPTSRLARELMRLQDTPEFSHVDDAPVVHTVWSNGKYVDPNQPPPEPVRKKAKVEAEKEEVASEEDEDEAEPVTNMRQNRVKKWLDRGLYAGQDIPKDITRGLTPGEKKNFLATPELHLRKAEPSKFLPPPLFNGLRTLINGRDFKLPFQVCNPLPPGQPKPDEWKRMTKNRFIGESKEYWRKSPHFHDFSSKCVCKPEDGCGESCQNRIMLYECDSSNCNVGKDFCRNRAFADLTMRRTKGGKYRVGVEVIKTSDRGYGVRSNRCFRPNQIIMEYAGEIITEEECERRMNEEYKENDCYYLMSFDQNMIIDATTGSIARFVNHSCNPNCHMIKWIVSGQPRMALFAGEEPILTGDELTYDYNFDPFSSKNVQKCLCGAENCRGVLGPRPREVRGSKLIKNAVDATVKAGKRKLDQLLGKGDAGGSPSGSKKRKIQPVKSVKQALTAVSLNATKKAATALKKGMSTVSKGAAKKPAAGKPTPPSTRPGSTTTKSTANSGAKKVTAKKVTTKKLIKKTPVKATTVRKPIVKTVALTKTYGKPVSRTKTTPRKKPSPPVKSMIVAKGDESTQPRKSPIRNRTPTKKAAAAAAAALTHTAQKKGPFTKNTLMKTGSPTRTLGLDRASEIKVAA